MNKRKQNLSISLRLLKKLSKLLVNQIPIALSVILFFVSCKKDKQPGYYTISGKITNIINGQPIKDAVIEYEYSMNSCFFCFEKKIGRSISDKNGYYEVSLPYSDLNSGYIEDKITATSYIYNKYQGSFSLGSMNVNTKNYVKNYEMYAWSTISFKFKQVNFGTRVTDCYIKYLNEPSYGVPATVGGIVLYSDSTHIMKTCAGVKTKIFWSVKSGNGSILNYSDSVITMHNQQLNYQISY